MIDPQLDPLQSVLSAPMWYYPLPTMFSLPNLYNSSYPNGNWVLPPQLFPENTAESQSKRTKKAILEIYISK